MPPPPASPSPEDFDRLLRAGEMIGAQRRYLVARVSSPTLGKTSGIVPLASLVEMVTTTARSR